MNSVKKVFLIVFILTVLVFVFNLFSSRKMKDLKDQNKSLVDSISVIQKDRDNLKIQQKELETKYESIEKDLESKKDDLKILDKYLEKSNSNLKRAKVQVYQLQSKLDSIEVRIKRIKENPINRNGDDLLNSLREKITK